MIFYKTDDDIEYLRQSNTLVSKTLAQIVQYLKVGTSLRNVDKMAEEFIRDNGGLPAFKGYRGFPSTLCMSLNDAVVHGIPNDHRLTSVDIISIDCGVLLNGYYGDSAYTFSFSEVGPDVERLLKVTHEALYVGIENARIGMRIGDISHAIQEYCEKQNNFSIVRELVGHGVGRSLHEDPEVPNFGNKGRGPVIKEGLVIAIEPMVNMGARFVKQKQDGWTILTKDGKMSAHFEHSVAVRRDGPDILSDHKIIEAEIKKNKELKLVSINFSDICAPN